MTAYGIAVALGLCLVSITLQNVYPPRELTWRNTRARLLLLTQGVVTPILIAGVLWSPDTEFAATWIAGWCGGYAIGLSIALWRARVPRTHTDAIVREPSTNA